MTRNTIQECAGGCGRIVDCLNDVPPVDEVGVHSTAVVDDRFNPWRLYCVECANQGGTSP